MEKRVINKDRYKEFIKIIKKKLREIRESRNLTQKALAKKLGISKQHYQRLETNLEAALTLKQIFNICELLSVPIGYFFKNVDDELQYIPPDNFPWHKYQIKSIHFKKPAPFWKKQAIKRKEKKNKT